MEEAREHYTQTIMAVINGETPEYTQKLVFSKTDDAGYTDEPTIPEDKLAEMK